MLGLLNYISDFQKTRELRTLLPPTVVISFDKDLDKLNENQREDVWFSFDSGVSTILSFPQP